MRAPRALRVLHVEDSEVDTSWRWPGWRADGRAVQTLRVEDEAAFVPRSKRIGTPCCRTTPARVLGAGGAASAAGQRPPAAVPDPVGEIGEDGAVQAMREGASDYLLKSNLMRLAPALDRAIEANETRRARMAADRECRPRASACRAGAAPCRAASNRSAPRSRARVHDDVGGAMTRAQVRTCLVARHVEDAAAQQRVQSALETAANAHKRASASCTTCARRSSSRGWSLHCTGWRSASRSAPASLASSARATNTWSCRPACRWWLTVRCRRR